MMNYKSSFYIFCFFIELINSEIHKTTIDLISEINNIQTNWVAEKNELSERDVSELKKLMGLKHKLKEERSYYYDSHKINEYIPNNLPEEFDSRKKWHTCASISSVKDQANCGSCWAVSAASVMSDRLCIESKHKIHVNLSAEALMTCCSACTGGGNGCDGGYLGQPWIYFKKHGLVTGGDYGSREGCQPYSIAPCPCQTEAEAPHCKKKSCTNKHYEKTYKNDLHKGKSHYALPQNETLIRADIFKHGPAVAGFEVYHDFMFYKRGVYKHTKGQYLGLHAVRVLGWGVENNTPYWLVANSWNTTWGDNGLFKIVRGENHCGFEDSFVAGIPSTKKLNFMNLI